MPDITIPGVYVEEGPGPTPPIIEGPTAVPCFVGYTATGFDPDGAPLFFTPTRVTSLLEYEQQFGGPRLEAMRVELQTDPAMPAGVRVDAVAPATAAPVFSLYWAVRQYFDNGGLACYIASVGVYGDAPDAAALTTGLESSAVEPSITLVVMPDAAMLAVYDDYRSVASALLQHSRDTQGRFALLDVWQGYLAPSTSVDVAAPGAPPNLRTVIEASRDAWTDHLQHGAAYYPFLVTAYTHDLVAPPTLVSVVLDGEGIGTLEQLMELAPTLAVEVRQAVAASAVVLPPSGAVAGAYAATDMELGVWTAPANRSLSAVLRPSVSLDTVEQEPLNIDPITGKSIDAIRAFTGKGTLVWGARTLDGNSQDWRYVPVRRLVNHLERSILNSTGWVAFEPNTAATWATLRATLENYLTVVWRNGGLNGARPQDAFTVACGLGQTMTADDVTNGQLSVMLALAVLRPAEFLNVTLRYAVQPA